MSNMINYRSPGVSRLVHDCGYQEGGTSIQWLTHSRGFWITHQRTVDCMPLENRIFVLFLLYNFIGEHMVSDVTVRSSMKTVCLPNNIYKVEVGGKKLNCNIFCHHDDFIWENCKLAFRKIDQFSQFIGLCRLCRLQFQFNLFWLLSIQFNSKSRKFFINSNSIKNWPHVCSRLVWVTRISRLYNYVVCDSHWLD